MDVETDEYRDPELKCARVKYPDGTYKQFDVDVGCKASDLFRQVTAGMSYKLKEREHFGLSFFDPFDGAKYWLDNYQELKFQLDFPDIETYDRMGPEERKRRDAAPQLPWEFSFEVRFYPLSPSTFVDDIARNFLFMQLRHDILSGRLTAEPDIHIRLGALLTQVVYGDAPYSDDQDYREFMVQTKLVPDTATDVQAQLVQLHSDHRGLTPSDAINQYMDLCATLPFYGAISFPAKNHKGIEVMFGVGPFGISIQQDGSLLGTCKWSEMEFKYRKYSADEDTICWINPKDDGNTSTYTYKFSDCHLYNRVQEYITNHIVFLKKGTIKNRKYRD